MIGFSARLSFARRCFFSLLLQGKIPQDILQALGGSKVEVASFATAAKATPGPPKVGGDKPSPESLDRAVQMLALLQRDGRLVDFLEEDVSPYPDGQLGAAVRNIHTSCRQVLERYIKLEPILSSEEDEPVTIPVGSRYQTGRERDRRTTNSRFAAPSWLARHRSDLAVTAAGFRKSDRCAGRGRGCVANLQLCADYSNSHPAQRSPQET